MTALETMSSNTIHTIIQEFMENIQYSTCTHTNASFIQKLITHDQPPMTQEIHIDLGLENKVPTVKLLKLSRLYFNNQSI